MILTYKQTIEKLNTTSHQFYSIVDRAEFAKFRVSKKVPASRRTENKVLKFKVLRRCIDFTPEFFEIFKKAIVAKRGKYEYKIK